MYCAMILLMETMMKQTIETKLILNYLTKKIETLTFKAQATSDGAQKESLEIRIEELKAVAEQIIKLSREAIELLFDYIINGDSSLEELLDLAGIEFHPAMLAR